MPSRSHDISRLYLAIALSSWTACCNPFAERRAALAPLLAAARQAGDVRDPSSARARLRVEVSFPETAACGSGARRYSATDSNEEPKARAAAALLQQVLRSPEFSQRVQGMVFLGDCQGKDSANGDLGFNPRQILGVLLSGADQRDQSVDHVIQLPLCVSNENEVGHTNGGPSWITSTSASVLQTHSPGYLAGHYLHEHMHRVGFWHTHSRTSTRSWSVPYAIGVAACEIATRFSGQPLLPHESCRDDGTAIQHYTREELDTE